MTQTRKLRHTTEVSTARPPLADGVAYLHGVGCDDRSELDPAWRQASIDQGARFYEVHVKSRYEFELHSDRGGVVEVHPRSRSELANLLAVPTRETVIDITALSPAFFGSLVAAARREGSRLKACYQLPQDYARKRNPSLGVEFDLSERIGDYGPLPGLGVARGPAEREHRPAVVTPLLGFEGTRLDRVLEILQPKSERIVSIIGSPGYRLENVFYALLGNQVAIDEYGLAGRFRYARADCPFDLFYELTSIHHAYQSTYTRVAPLGSRPHILGAVLFAVENPREAELIYDFPLERKGRSLGRTMLVEYDLSGFWSDLDSGDAAGLGGEPG